MLFGLLPLFENSNLRFQAAVCSFQWERFIWLVWLKPPVLFVRLGGLGGNQKPKGVLVSFSPTDKQLICRSSAKQVSSSKRSRHWAMRGGLLSLTLFSLLSLEGKHGHQKHYLYHIYLILGSNNLRLVSYHLKVNSTHFLLIMIWLTAIPCIIIFRALLKISPRAEGHLIFIIRAIHQKQKPSLWPKGQNEN